MIISRCLADRTGEKCTEIINGECQKCTELSVLNQIYFSCLKYCSSLKATYIKLGKIRQVRNFNLVQLYDSFSSVKGLFLTSLQQLARIRIIYWRIALFSLQVIYVHHYNITTVIYWKSQGTFFSLQNRSKYIHESIKLAETDGVSFTNSFIKRCFDNWKSPFL